MPKMSYEVCMDFLKLYESYKDISEGELRECVVSLEDIGSGAEVVDIANGIANAEIRLRLIEKAIRLGATFTEDDYLALDGKISSQLYIDLAKYGQMDLGSAENVARVLQEIFDPNAKRALYERAYIDDVRFTPAQLDRIGYDDIDSAHDNEDYCEDDTERPKGLGCLGAFLALGTLFSRKKK